MRLTLFLDHACNMACTYCYNGTKFSRPMSLETAAAGLTLALQAPTPLVQVGFFGGEPLLHRELILRIVDLVRKTVEGRQHLPLFTATTNGTLLDRETIREQQSFGMHYGISIDGPEQHHNQARPYPDGRGTFHKVMEAIDRVVEAGAPLKTATVTTPRNAGCLDETFRMLVARGVRYLHFGIDFQSCWTDEDLLVYRQSLRRLGEAWAEVCRAGGPLVQVNIFEKKIRSHIMAGHGCADECDFGCAEWAVAPSGRVYACDRLVGEDTREDLAVGDVHGGGIFPDRLREQMARKNHLSEGCADCRYQHRCMHRCACVNLAMTGDMGEVHGLLCAFEQIHIEESDRVAATLFSEKNPAFLHHFYRRAEPLKRAPFFRETTEPSRP